MGDIENFKTSNDTSFIDAVDAVDKVTFMEAADKVTKQMALMSGAFGALILGLFVGALKQNRRIKRLERDDRRQKDEMKYNGRWMIDLDNEVGDLRNEVNGLRNEVKTLSNIDAVHGRLNNIETTLRNYANT